MVSAKCKAQVEEELLNLGIDYESIDLGVIETREEITESQKIRLKRNLFKSGLELIDDKRSILVERTKSVIIEMVYCSSEFPKENYSDYISKKLNMGYGYLSNIFSEVQGLTIRQFVINNKIEKAKELLLYRGLNLTEISYRLNYSSVAHLSNQFKKINGLSPSLFKRLNQTKNVV